MISDAAVKAATGKSWDKWREILDIAGAAEWDHKTIAAHLRKLGVGRWWNQMVTVGYERASGRRAVNQTATGYSLSASKTIAVPISRIFAAWTTEAARRRWLTGSKLDVSKATKNKSIRYGWNGGKSRVEVLFYSKGEAKAQVVVNHTRLGSAKDAARFRAFWGGKLERLKLLLQPKP
jgi:hypothetical protein